MLSWSKFPIDEWPDDRWVVGIPVVDPKAEKLTAELRKLAVDAAKLAAIVEACATATRPRTAARKEL